MAGFAFKLSVIRLAAFGPDKSGNGDSKESENEDEDEDSVNMRFLPAVFPPLFLLPLWANRRLVQLPRVSHSLANNAEGSRTPSYIEDVCAAVLRYLIFIIKTLGPRTCALPSG